MKNIVFPVIMENEKKLPFYLASIGCWYRQEHVIRPNGYPNFQWIQCHDGEGELLVHGKVFRIRPQQGMLLYPNVPHEYYSIKEPWQIDWIDFNGHHIDYFLQTNGFVESEVLFVANGDILLSKIRALLRIAQSNYMLKGYDCSGIIYDILIHLVKFASKSSDESVQQQRQRLQPVFEYIEQNYSNVISLEELADLLHVTPEHFCLLFKKIMNMRPFEYLSSVRIHKSKHIIITDHAMSIGEIAHTVGYDNVSYFCSVFKKTEGMSPGKFRRLYGV